MTDFYDPVNASASPEVQMNDGFKSLEGLNVYAKRPSTTSALTWGYWGGIWGGFSVSTGTLSLTAGGSPSVYNYVVVARATGAISVSTATTNWNNTKEYARVYKIETSASAVILVEDHRAGPYGVHGQKFGIVWNEETDNYTLALTDGGNGVAMNKSTAVNLTVPPNSSVALWERGEPVLVRQKGAGTVSFVQGSGVSIILRESGSPTFKETAGRNAVAALIPTEVTDEWVLTGDIA